MRLLVYSHEACWRHNTGDGHPERPARLDAVLAGIRSAGVATVEAIPPRAETAALARVHRPAYIERIEAFCRNGGGALDPDTHAVADSWEAALRAAGAGLDAVGRLEDDEAAFLAVRPPGHHAEHARAMGFCLFNNVAVTAQRLIDDGQRVAVLDWDVHHGNGTQDSFLTNPDLLYASLHEFPAYPGTGWLDEVGDGAGTGSTVNVPLPAGTAGDVYRQAFGEVVMPVLELFEPDWVLVSAGYDAHADDPLAGLGLVAADYGHMAAALARWTGRLVFFLEGGYHLEAVTASVRATVRGLAGGEAPGPPAATPAGSPARRLVAQAAAAAGSFWPLG